MNVWFCIGEYFWIIKMAFQKILEKIRLAQAGFKPVTLNRLAAQMVCFWDIRNLLMEFVIKFIQSAGRTWCDFLNIPAEISN